jgi:GT2 family glycosyltransferase
MNLNSASWTRTGLSISTALDLIRMAIRTSGSGAPALLAAYASLWRLHRSYPDKRIRRLPKTKLAGPENPNSTRASTAGRGADIVIPVYNNFDDTKALLEQLRNEAADHRSITLVNDCSTDARMSPMLANYCNEVNEAILLENERNLGFVKTCNRGFENTVSDVVILNTDIELPADAVTRLVATLRSADDIAAVAPFSNSAYGLGVPDLIHHNERPFEASTTQIDEAFQTLSNLSPINIPRGVGFCMAMSRKVIDRIGPFSTDFGQGYGEEADFCMRAHYTGFRSVIAPDIYAYHKGGQSFGGAWQKKARAGQLIFLHRHPGYVNMMRDYLDGGEALAAIFMALVALSRSLSGREPNVIAAGQFSGSSPTPSDVPVVSVINSTDKVDVRLSMMGEAYQFSFAGSEVAREAFERIQIPFPLH